MEKKQILGFRQPNVDLQINTASSQFAITQNTSCCTEYSAYIWEEKTNGSDLCPLVDNYHKKKKS